MSIIEIEGMQERTHTRARFSSALTFDGNGDGLQHLELFAIVCILADAFVRPGVLVHDILEGKLPRGCVDTGPEPFQPGRHWIQMGPATEGTWRSEARDGKREHGVSHLASNCVLQTLWTLQGHGAAELNFHLTRFEGIGSGLICASGARLGDGSVG